MVICKVEGIVMSPNFLQWTLGQSLPPQPGQEILWVSVFDGSLCIWNWIQLSFMSMMPMGPAGWHTVSLSLCIHDLDCGWARSGAYEQWGDSEPRGQFSHWRQHSSPSAVWQSCWGCYPQWRWPFGSCAHGLGKHESLWGCLVIQPHCPLELLTQISLVGKDTEHVCSGNIRKLSSKWGWHFT